MTGNERLARAVLLFFRGGPWTDDDRAVWETMTGYPTPTAATLCDSPARCCPTNGCEARAFRTRLHHRRSRDDRADRHDGGAAGGLLLGGYSVRTRRRSPTGSAASGWLAGDAKPWQLEAVTVVSERLVFKPRLSPVA